MTAAFGNSYGYDANGNQTTRTIGGVAYTFAYDYENHLTAVSGGSISASFVDTLCRFWKLVCVAYDGCESNSAPISICPRAVCDT